MNRLFAKIFFGFWLTTIAVVITTAVLTEQLFRAADDDRLAQHFERTQVAYAAAAASILTTDGAVAAVQWLTELRGPGGARGRLQLLDEAGRALNGPAPAPDILAAIEAADGSVNRAVPARVFVEGLKGASGERYWFVSDLRRTRPRFTRHGLDHGPAARGFGGFRFAVALLVSGLVCYGLARYLTQPIRRLQRASAEIANGNFNVRVADDRRHDELGDLGRDFDRMAARLDRLHRSQQQLLRDVSHELRSPLARLQIALGLARQRGGAGIGQELERIEREAEALEDLIAQLLSVARLEAGADELAREAVDVHELLAAVVHDANFEGAKAGKSVRLEGPVAVVVQGERVLLKSAFENVVRNALTATPDWVEVGIGIDSEPAPGYVTVQVRDHGAGVDKDLIEYLFKPFVRAEAARERERGGYGIGLAIAEAAVKRHGGNISARNHPERGLCVEIKLPVATSAT